MSGVNPASAQCVPMRSTLKRVRTRTHTLLHSLSLRIISLYSIASGLPSDHSCSRDPIWTQRFEFHLFPPVFCRIFFWHLLYQKLLVRFCSRLLFFGNSSVLYQVVCFIDLIELAGLEVPSSIRSVSVPSTYLFLILICRSLALADKQYRDLLHLCMKYYSVDLQGNEQFHLCPLYKSNFRLCPIMFHSVYLVLIRYWKTWDE